MSEVRAIRGDHWLLRWSKWRIAGAYWLVQSLLILLAIIVWAWQAATVNGEKGRPLGELGELDEVGSIFGESDFWITWGIVNGVMIALQVLILLPVRKPRPRVMRGWPLGLSVVAMGTLIAALATGLAYALMVGGLELSERADREAGETRSTFWDLLPYLFMGVVAVGWLTGTVLLWKFCARRLRAGEIHEDVLRRVASRLFVGTMIETAALIPLDVMIRRRTECYCVAGSFVGLTVCGAVGLVVLGPMMVLPYVAARRKRWWLSRCDACGYDVASLLKDNRGLERCPECGTGWRNRAEPRGEAA